MLSIHQVQSYWPHRDINKTGGKRQILGSVIKREQKYRQQPAWGLTKGRRMGRERGGRNESERGKEEGQSNA